MVNKIDKEDNASRTSTDLKECLSFLRSMVNDGIEIKLWENKTTRKVVEMAIRESRIMGGDPLSYTFEGWRSHELR